MVFFQEILQGTFHQGHPKFGETASRQCSCCALFCICFTIVKSPGHWKQPDLDHIVEEGDKLYKSKNTSIYLMSSELPTVVSVFNKNLQIQLLDNNLRSTFISKPSQSNVNGLILFLKGLCIAVLWTKHSNFFCLILIVRMQAAILHQMVFQYC